MRHCLAFLLSFSLLALAWALSAQTSAPPLTPELVEPAYGKATLAPNADVVARSTGTWSITYTVGEKGLGVGGKLRIGYSHIVSDWTPPQMDDPQGAGYMTVDSSKPLRKAVTPTAGNVEFYRGPSHDLYLTIANENAPLVEGDTIRVTFHRTTVQSYDEKPFLFEVSADADGGGQFHQVANLRLNIIGDKATRLVVFAPSVVEVGKPFDAVVKAEDNYFNPAPNYTGTVTLRWDHVRGTARVARHTFKRGERGVHVFRGIVSPAQGFVYLAAGDSNGLRGRSNPIQAVSRLDRKIYWGELHGHTALSDGRGTADNYYTYARDVARVDFAAMTDHDIQNKYGIPYMWEQAQRAAAKFNDAGRFVTFLAWEWSGSTPQGGDHNTFYLNDFQPIFPVRPITDLWKALGDRDALTIPHVGGRVGNWDFHDERYQRLAEMYSAHGIFEWFLEDALRRGYKVGTVAATDDHEGHPANTPASVFWNTRGGLTAVYADRLTRPGIWDALYRRRCYATSGARLFLDFRCGDKVMGEEATTNEPPTFRVNTAGTGNLLQVDLIKNGQTIYTYNVGHQRSNPRTLRILCSRKTPQGRSLNLMEGSLTTEEGTLEAIYGLHFESYREGIREARGQRITWQFSCERADVDGALVHVYAVGEAKFTLKLGDATFPFALSDLDKNSGELLFAAEPLVVTVTDVNPAAPRTAAFTYKDMEKSDKKTDYYYVRVAQMDGQMAWSSPIWVTRP